LFVNKLISLIAFLVLLGAGWVALSYLRTEMSDSIRVTSADAQPAPATAPSVKPGETSGVQMNTLAAPSRLVYSCPAESDYYHTASHMTTRCKRQAVSEEAALRRGLKPCNVCISP
jgi:hypothetical protein